METLTSQDNPSSDGTAKRVAELFKQQHQSVIKHADRLLGWLMVCQWLVSLAAAALITPRTWAGTQSQIHVHLLAAFFLGGTITALPVFLAFNRPGLTLTRHTIAVGQMMMSALLIHLTGGRLETHFHVFGSLAILAFYRDWRVLMSGSIVVYVDHLLRGYFWPQSVYGVLSAPIWRSLEHAGWVMFEVTFLVLSIRKSLSEMHSMAERQATLESINDVVERKVALRTAELTHENLERRQAEEKLKKSETQLAKAQHIARMGSWEWDVSRDLVTWSAETCRLHGFEPQDTDEPMERRLERIHSADRQRVREALAAAVRTHQPFECSHRINLPDGGERVIHGMAEVMLNERGEAVKMIGTARDVTEAKLAEEALKMSEEQLRQSQKMEAVGRLAGGMAHDFNNLLTVITGYTSLSLQKMAKEHPLRRNAEVVQNAAERAAGLTGQLLALSRKQVLLPQVLLLNEVVAGMQQMLERLIGEDVELTTTFEPGLGNVLADPGQLQQVVLNMAVNARDAMPRGGKLSIRTANVSLDQASRFRNRDLNVGEYVMLAISDTGTGMTEDVKAHLFEPFFTTKGVGRGTGLGLATSYGIVAQSGGDIRVYSEPDRGTTFKVYLPRVDCPVIPAAPQSGSEVLPRGVESVLVVEDDDAVRTLSASVLRECGYQVSEARDAIEALGFFNARSAFALVITDVIMPKMSGKELFERLKILAPKAKVLFMSGYTDDMLVNHLVVEPDLCFLEKPFSPARLARKVREVLDAAPVIS